MKFTNMKIADTCSSTNMAKHSVYKRQSKVNVIGSILKEVLYNSLAQSIIKIIFSPHKSIELFLFVCVLCSSGFASYFVIQSIMIYMSFGVSTTTRTFFEIPNLFPKVTFFCNLNWFTTESLVMN
jgi:hypothetical protein